MSPRDQRTIHLDPAKASPSIAAAVTHLEGLRRHLLELGLRAEAEAAATVLDLLVPAQSGPVPRPDETRR